MVIFAKYGSLVSALIMLIFVASAEAQRGARCQLQPLGPGKDDTDQVEAAIAKCGHFGTTSFASGSYNITRKMMWNLKSSKVDLRGFLTYPPWIDYWKNATNTYRVVFIQSQASWFVVTGTDFEIDAHNVGGIQGNGQTWWSYLMTHTRTDGDGRPISLTVWNATRGIIRNFRIESPPFWSNAVAESKDITYDGMFVNATNTDPLYAGRNAVFNTDGIDTYRSDRITMLNWDVTCGDDCLAFKGNSTNLVARNIICRGGNGITFGSLGQYANMSDHVYNVEIENLRTIRLDPKIQPNMASGVYFKTWSATVNGSPPNMGGGGGGFVNNVTAKNVFVDRAATPLHLFQTNLAQPGDAPSKLKFSNLRFINWRGSGNNSRIIDLECSPAAGCTNISFKNFKVLPPVGQAPRYICQNVSGITGLSAPCNATGEP